MWLADIESKEEWELIRRYLLQTNVDNGLANHYWLGGYLDQGDGQMHWLTGNPMVFNDFIAGEPSGNPYIHITPGNNYSWNTKDDKQDTNNGYVCKGFDAST